MFQERDVLVREVQRIARAVATLLRRGRAEEDVRALATAASGLDPDVARRLPAGTVLALMTTAEGLDAPRVLALALALGADRADRERADALIVAAITARPSLLTDEVQEAWDRIRAAAE